MFKNRIDNYLVRAAIGGSKGGPGGHVPPLDHSKLIVFSEFCVGVCLAKLAHR